MGRTVDLSMSDRTRQYVVAGLVLAWPVPPVVGLAVTVGIPLGLALPAVAVCWALLTVTWVRRTDESDDSSVWGPIPRSQYLGRFAGAGGLVREEQEEALGHSDDE